MSLIQTLIRVFREKTMRIINSSWMSFENEKIQTISTQLYYVFTECHNYIKVGDRDSLQKIISEMVEHRLDNPKLVPYVPSFSPIKGIKTPPRIYR